MRHPTEGVLRRLVDEPAGVADADREHVAGCPQCLAGLAAAREDAVLVGAALRAPTAPPTSTPPGGGCRRPRAPRPPDRRAPARPGRGARAPAPPAVAALAPSASSSAGAGAAAANDWLPIFRTQQIAPVEHQHRPTSSRCPT